MKYQEFFPYEDFRQQQEAIIRIVEKASKERKNTLLVAPNGTGKTIITLSALLPIAYEKDLKIIYACRTHAQNTRVIKELNRVSRYIQNTRSTLVVNGISIRGRNEMCLNETILNLKVGPKESMAVCLDLRRNRNCRYFNNLMKKEEDLKNPAKFAPDLLNKPADAEEIIDFCNSFYGIKSKFLSCSIGHINSIMDAAKLQVSFISPFDKLSKILNVIKPIS